MHPANSNYEIHLNSGRKIVLEEIHQHLTYAGLLEGLPNQRINDGIISELKNIVSDKIYDDIKKEILDLEKRVSSTTEEIQHVNKSESFLLKEMAMKTMLKLTSMSDIENLTKD